MYAVRTTIMMPKKLKICDFREFVCMYTVLTTIVTLKKIENMRLQRVRTHVRTIICWQLSFKVTKSVTYEGFVRMYAVRTTIVTPKKLKTQVFREFVRMYARTHNNLLATIFQSYQICHI